MLRRRWHWAVFFLVAAASAAFAVAFFPRALPIVAIDLEMEREAALQAAAAIADGEALGPQPFRQAASFGQQDAAVQVYVELEGGGRDAFVRLREDGLFEPYVWQVRHFRAGEATEGFFRFTPDGSFYGYTVRLPEDEPGASLSAADARALAEAAAAARGIDLAAFDPVDASQVVRTGGRTDHDFTYQRRGVDIGEAQVRLRLGVAGDRVSEIRHFVHVPEGFARRYEEMRAANQTVALLANLVFMLVFLVGGCGVGTFLLLRRGWIVWRTPLVWGVAISALMALATLNGMPLSWMGYDTATSEATFVAGQVGMALAILMFGAPLLALIFMAAESLTRRAFPQQVQQWRLWSPGVANTDAVLGRTLGGYLQVPINLAFVVAFYFFGTQYFGWWTPSDVLVDPDIVATRFPWITAVALAAFSGFWEEALFRAVPIAGAALIGQRFGRPALWIGFALVLQAVVFAAAHADYPQQPAYARVVELILPAFVWGLVFLRWGLLPVALAHFAFNLSLMSLPLLTASAAGLLPSKLMVIIAGLTPLGIVLFARWRQGAAAEVPADALNAAWTPAVGMTTSPATGDIVADVAGDASEPIVEVHTSEPLPAWARWALPAAGVLGLVAWVLATPRVPDQPSLQLDRAKAAAIAEAALRDERGFAADDEWRAMPHTFAERLPAARFAWREGGRDAYMTLRDRFALSPRWHVRYARFTGPVEERAEEYRVIIRHDGTVHRIEQQLPEARPGATLEEDDARALAHAAIAQRFNRDASLLREVTANATAHPERRDWEFAYADNANYPLESGEARLAVLIAGDLVVDAYPYIHVPDEWSRAERSRRMPGMILGIMAGAQVFVLFALALVIGVVRWSRGPDWPTRLVLVIFAGAMVLLGINFWNSMPAATALFVTAQPWETQLFGVAAVFVLILLVGAAGVAIAAGLVQAWKPDARAPGDPVLSGAAAGLLVAGAAALLGRLGGTAAPVGGSYAGADAAVPTLAAAIGPVSGYVTTTLALLILLVGTERVTAGWTRKRWPAATLLVLIGTVLLAGRIPEIQWTGLLPAVLGGVALLLFYLAARRLHFALVPVATAMLAALGQVQQVIFQPFPGAAPGAGVAVLLLLGLSVAWARLLLSPSRRSPTTAASSHPPYDHHTAQSSAGAAP